MRMRTPLRQRGVAVITALLLTTLAISIVASLFWQQQVQVRSMENQRLHLQTRWILRGALDWASLVLRQDGYDHPQFTWLSHVWATPLAETRLDQYIERERVEGEVFNATLSGSIADANSRYNLTNLAAGGTVDPNQLKVFAQLLQGLQLDPALALRTANLVAAGQPMAPAPPNPQGGGGGSVGGASVGGNGSGGGNVVVGGGAPLPAQPRSGSKPMKLLQVDDLLAVQGFTPEAVAKLRAFVTVLPDQSMVNVNTASAEVLASVVPNYSVAEANALVARRKTGGWRTMAEFEAELQGRTVLANVADVRSEWFLVYSRIRLDRAALDAESLVYRPLGGAVFGGTTVKWTRQN